MTKYHVTIILQIQGVRHNKRACGIMRILFIAKLIQDRVLTPYNLYALSAACRKRGHDTSVVDAVSVRHIRRAIQVFKPDVLAYSTHTARWPFFREAARRIKSEFGLPQLFGGAHPTFRPDIALEPFIDGVCMGEADEALPELLDEMQSGRDFHTLSNWCFRSGDSLISNPPRPLVRDLDSLPFPHFALTNSYSYCRSSPLFILITSRGCMFRCSYCSLSAYAALYSTGGEAYYRRMSVARAIGEVRHVITEYPCGFISFFDDHMTDDSDWVLEFADRYRAAGGPPFSCNMVVQFVKKEHVRALAEAGLKWVGISLEAGNPYLRKNVLNRHYDNDSFVEAISILKEAGVKTYVGNVLTFPGSTLETDLETLYLNRRAGVDIADASIFIPLPGTKLGEAAFAGGLIDRKIFFSKFHSFDASFHAPTICDVPHRKYARRLHCLFEIAGDYRFVADNINLLIKLPLTPLYIILYKIHNVLAKRFLLFRELKLPLRTQLSLIFYNILQI